MKLNDVPKGSVIVADVTDDKGTTSEQEITFHHLDGMYSYCTLPSGDTAHLSVMTPLERIDGKQGYYRIEDN